MGGGATRGADSQCGDGRKCPTQNGAGQRQTQKIITDPGQQQARVRYRRFEPGTYAGTWYWDEDDEVEIYQVNVEVPMGTPANATVLEVQAICGGDHVHARTRF